MHKGPTRFVYYLQVSRVVISIGVHFSMRAVSSALLNLFFLMTLTTSDKSTSYGGRRDSTKLGLVHKIRAGRPTNCGLIIPGWEKQLFTTPNRPDVSGAHQPLVGPVSVFPASRVA